MLLLLLLLLLSMRAPNSSDSDAPQRKCRCARCTQCEAAAAAAACSLNCCTPAAATAAAAAAALATASTVLRSAACLQEHASYQLQQVHRAQCPLRTQRYTVCSSAAVRGCIQQAAAGATVRCAVALQQQLAHLHRSRLVFSKLRQVSVKLVQCSTALLTCSNRSCCTALACKGPAVADGAAAGLIAVNAV
eukprot:12902-Heterococcus_DN1.PRE.1